MKFGTLFASILVVMSLACSSTKNLTEETIASDTTKTVLYYKGSGKNKKLVKEEKYFDNGQMMSVQNFKKGQLHGEWKTWLKNGSPQEEGMYENGFKNGHFKFYDGTGELLYEGDMKDDMKHGTWTTWYDDSQMEEQKEYKDGQLDGRWVYWYIDGNLRREETYQNGVKLTEINYE